MIIDTSAVVSILNNEEDAADIERRLMETAQRRMSAASYVELSMVVAKSGVPGDITSLDELLDALEVEIVNVTYEDALLAREGFLRYGKGRHPAKLNFGDCFSYALAKRLNEPLLFKGNDFSQTDVLKA